MKVLILSLFFVASISIQSNGQSNTLSGGGDASDEGGSVSYSIGQVAYQYIETDEYFITEGLQQTQIVNIDAIGEQLLESLNISVYPNPTRYSLNIKIDNYQNEEIQYQLFTMEGQSIIQGQLTQMESIIPLADHPPGIYLFKLFGQDRDYRSFRIIKL